MDFDAANYTCTACYRVMKCGDFCTWISPCTWPATVIHPESIYLTSFLDFYDSLFFHAKGLSAEAFLATISDRSTARGEVRIYRVGYPMKL